MKKRVKLLTTIASLCLAVALMAFGVYAATSATFNVKSNVTFDIGLNLDGTVKVELFKSASATGGTSVDSQEFDIASNATENPSDVTLADIQLTYEYQYAVLVVTYTPHNDVDASIVITPSVTKGDEKGTWTVPGASTAATNSATNYIQYYGDEDIKAANKVAISFSVVLTGAEQQG